MSNSKIDRFGVQYSAQALADGNFTPRALVTRDTESGVEEFFIDWSEVFGTAEEADAFAREHLLARLEASFLKPR